MTIENLNPSVYQKLDSRKLTTTDYDNDYIDEIDEREVFDYIRSIQDPEHPLTLEELNVLDIESVNIDKKNSVCYVQFTPTIPHCSKPFTFLWLIKLIYLFKFILLRYGYPDRSFN